MSTADPAPEYIIDRGMRFRVTEDGLVYAPLPCSAPRKHPCKDCRQCGWCPESRCRRCLAKTPSCQ